ncbi:hypothetical protein ACLKA6_008806 [Drosophila palustris]
MSISGNMLRKYYGAVILLICISSSWQLVDGTATANAGYVDHGDTKARLRSRFDFLLFFADFLLLLLLAGLLPK